MTPLAATEAERSLTERQKDMEVAAQQHNAGRTPKFGDLMRNPWAGEGNPTRDGYFVRSKRVTGRFNPGLWYEMTDRLDKFWEINGKVAMFVDEPARASQQSAAQATADPVKPSGYAYRYPDGYIRFSNGEQINGSSPVESIAYYFVAPDRAPSTDSAADARDAARYRWLRDKSEPGICAFYLSVGKAFDGVKFTQATVDEAIDAQIAASMPQTK